MSAVFLCELNLTRNHPTMFAVERTYSKSRPAFPLNVTTLFIQNYFQNYFTLKIPLNKLPVT